MRTVMFALRDFKLVGELESKYLVSIADTAGRYDDIGGRVQRLTLDALVIGDNLLSDAVDLEDAVRGAHEVQPNMQIFVLAGRDSKALEIAFQEMENVQIVPSDRITVDELATLLELHRGASTTFQFTCWSNKGGVGKTTLVQAAAQALKRVGGAAASVLVVDLDLEAGDVAEAFGVSQKAERDIVQLILAGDFRPETVRKYIYTSHPSGVDILPAPNSPLDAQGSPLTPATYTQIHEAIMRMGYQFIIYDLPARLMNFEAGRMALEDCDRIYFVVNKDHLPLKSLAKIRYWLVGAKLIEKCRFVVNKNRRSARYHFVTPEWLKETFSQIDTTALIAPDDAIADAQGTLKTMWDHARGRTLPRYMRDGTADVLEFARAIYRDAGYELEVKELPQPASPLAKVRALLPGKRA